MGYLTDEELEAARITRMILHVVGGDAPFEPQKAFDDVQQEDFFLRRIAATNAASLFTFEPTSLTKKVLEQVSAGEKTFEAGGQELAELFGLLHTGAARDGTLFMFELDVGNDSTTVYSLVKYDYGEAVERTQNKLGEAELRRIVQAFVTDRKALQKSAIVRLTNSQAAPEISATDRMGQSPDLTDYFQKFLGVKRARNDEELNKALARALRTAFIALKEELPGLDVGEALKSAKDALSQRQHVDDEAVLEAAFLAAGDPPGEEAREAITKFVGKSLAKEKLGGLKFKPDKSYLARASRKQIVTAEGVTIQYPSNLENTRVRREKFEGAREIITIETQRVEDVSILPDQRR